MIERLKQYAKAKGISQSKMEQALGKSRGYLSVVTNMSTDVLEKACTEYPDISCEWLVRGQGPMTSEPVATEADKKNEILLARLEQANSRIMNLEIELELRNA